MDIDIDQFLIKTAKEVGKQLKEFPEFKDVSARTEAFDAGTRRSVIISLEFQQRSKYILLVLDKGKKHLESQSLGHLCLCIEELQLFESSFDPRNHIIFEDTMAKNRFPGDVEPILTTDTVNEYKIKIVVDRLREYLNT